MTDLMGEDERAMESERVAEAERATSDGYGDPYHGYTVLPQRYPGRWGRQYEFGDLLAWASSHLFNAQVRVIVCNWDLVLRAVCVLLTDALFVAPNEACDTARRVPSCHVCCAVVAVPGEIWE